MDDSLFNVLGRSLRNGRSDEDLLRGTREVVFRGRKYLFLEDPTGGALATKHQYLNFERSFAHVIDGKIIRLGKCIGTSDELKEV